MTLHLIILFLTPLHGPGNPVQRRLQLPHVGRPPFNDLGAQCKSFGFEDGRVMNRYYDEFGFDALFSGFSQQIQSCHKGQLHARHDDIKPFCSQLFQCAEAASDSGDVVSLLLQHPAEEIPFQSVRLD